MAGFQNTGLTNSASHARSTRQTNPLLPLTAVSYPFGVSTMMVALPEMDGGAALFASAISALRSIIYWSTGAIVAYGAACAADAHSNSAAQTDACLKIVDFIAIPPRQRTRPSVGFARHRRKSHICDSSIARWRESNFCSYPAKFTALPLTAKGGQS